MKRRTRNYTPDDISVLKGLAAIRARPDMYVGSTSGSMPSGLYRLCREAVDNSIDEHLGGFCTRLRVEYSTEDRSTSVADDGRGIPVGRASKYSTDSLTLVFTEIHAGGKFSRGDSSPYKTSSGKNGVGQKAIAALSAELQVWSSNSSDKKWHTQKFARGAAASEVEREEPPEGLKIGSHGTALRWKPDPEIFTDGIDLDLERLESELTDVSYLCPDLEITLCIDGREKTLPRTSGISELAAQMSGGDFPTFAFSSPEEDVAVSFNFRATSFKSFVNVVNTDMGGTHLKGLKKALTNAIRAGSKQDLSADDVLGAGMCGVIHYRSENPQYQSQTKNELTSSDAEKKTIDLLEPALKTFFRKNRDLLSRLVEKAEESRQRRLSAREEKSLERGLRELEKRKFISEKFSDADRRRWKASDLELFIVEGDSAGGHFKSARESFQACLKLRGKVINAAKAGKAKLFGSKTEEGNREIRDLTSALGCGILDQYNSSKLRFGKVIIMTDADTDGLHITNLIMAFFIKYMPNLIREGHLYTLDAPLFLGSGVSSSGESVRSYGSTRQEVENDMKTKKCSNYHLTRMKGWGECNASDLSLLCISPETRKLNRIVIDETTERVLEETMSDDSEYRKKLILSNEKGTDHV